MLSGMSAHMKAILQALLVTFLWSTSWVLIKYGLAEIPPVTFAGLRYALAWLCLAPFALGASQRAQLRQLRRGDWVQLVALGVLMYALTQGAQYVGLAYLPAMTVSLLLNSTTLVVAVLGIIFLGEKPTVLQWGGVLLFMVGNWLYFYPVDLPAGQVVGFVAVGAGVLGNAASAVLGRGLGRARDAGAELA